MSEMSVLGTGGSSRTFACVKKIGLKVDLVSRERKPGCIDLFRIDSGL